MSKLFKEHFPLSLSTTAFKCANCGAVSLDPNSICVIQGKVKRSDWCGSESIDMIPRCLNNKNNKRYKCSKCGRIAMNPELLCAPEDISISKDKKI